MPHLSFPEDINIDPREKRNKHAKPKGEQRFSLKKSTGADGKKGGYGKKSKLLEFNVKDEPDESLQDEPIEIDRLPAARGQPATVPKQNLALRGDSSKSNKIKKISFLKKESLVLDAKIPMQDNEKLQTSIEYPSSMLDNKILSHESERRTFNDQNEFSEEVFYLKERSVRPIYQDDELHVLMLSLMMCLLLKPERGTLDELYCSQFPIQDDNQNILYLLHWHLSHPNNQNIVPSLLKKMEQVSPPLAGIRLLKLMCPSLFDISLYNNG